MHVLQKTCPPLKCLLVHYVWCSVLASSLECASSTKFGCWAELRILVAKGLLLYKNKWWCRAREKPRVLLFSWIFSPRRHLRSIDYCFPLEQYVCIEIFDNSLNQVDDFQNDFTTASLTTTFQLEKWAKTTKADFWKKNWVGATFGRISKTSSKAISWFDTFFEVFALQARP